MASGGGGMMQIVWIIIVLWVVVEIGLPLAKRLMGEVKDVFSFRARAYNSMSYI